MGRNAVRAVSIALGCALAWAVLLIALHPGHSGQLIALPAVALTLLAATLCAAVLSRLSVPLGRTGRPSVPPRRSAPAPARVHDPDRPGTVRPRAPGDCRI